MTSSTPPPTTTGHDPVGDIITGDTRPAGESLDYNTATDGEADVPVVFYATNTPHNPIAAAGVKARKNSWLFYQSLLPDLDDDVDLTLTSLAKDLGLTYSILSGIIRAHFRMQELPLVTATNRQQWILDTPRLRVIDREIERVGDNHEHIGLVDAALADFLTPTAPSQHVPTVAEIRRFIRDFIDTHQLAVDDTDEVEPALNVAVHNNRATISLTCDKATAAIIARHIDTQADNNRCGAGEALIQLILDNTHTKVAINTFTTDTTGDNNPAGAGGGAGEAKVYFPGYGWSSITNLENIDTFTRQLKPEETSGYQPTSHIRAYTQGRDLTCRWPGCTTPAHKCQLDHRIEYNNGGPTSPDNLVTLCQHHHNIKTDKRVHYIMDPVTGTIAWLHTDGTYHIDHPKGPLATTNTHWHYTWKQFLTHKRNKHNNKK
ncbi:HNH endonuclease signature motif containing protein [Corynebacterium rhinophilum]|uniref:HNH endonuclease signature motif containing protein n=1 Tax=Corynebacterium rhinophilum TaxID=3050197 RepID=UPI003979342A